MVNYLVSREKFETFPFSGAADSRWLGPVAPGPGRPVAFMPTEAQAPGQVWAVDFVEDKLVSGRRLRILSVLDLCSRYARTSWWSTA